MGCKTSRHGLCLLQRWTYQIIVLNISRTNIDSDRDLGTPHMFVCGPLCPHTKSRVYGGHHIEYIVILCDFFIGEKWRRKKRKKWRPNAWSPGAEPREPRCPRHRRPVLADGAPRRVVLGSRGTGRARARARPRHEQVGGEQAQGAREVPPADCLGVKGRDELCHARGQLYGLRREVRHRHAERQV